MRGLLSFFSTIAIIGLLATSSSAQDWNPQIADDAGDVGYGAKVVALSDGTPYLAAFSEYGDLRLSWWVEPGGIGGWNHAVIAEDGREDAGLDLAVDDDDRLHVVWHDYESHSYRVLYGVLDPQTLDWVTGPEVAMEPTYWVESVALTVWNDGTAVTPSIAISDEDQGLFVAHKDPQAGWYTDQVTGAHYVRQAKITSDTQGGLHVSFYDVNGVNLMYAAKPAGQDEWAIQTVDYEGQVGSYNSIVVDPNNDVHIAYYDGSNGDLKFATTQQP